MNNPEKNKDLQKMKNRTNNPNGRPKGIPNKITASVKSSVELLINSNLQSVQRWIRQVAKNDPARAVELVIELSKLVIPKTQAITIDSLYDRLPDDQLDYLLINLANKEDGNIQNNDQGAKNPALRKNK